MGEVDGRKGPREVASRHFWVLDISASYRAFSQAPVEWEGPRFSTIHRCYREDRSLHFQTLASLKSKERVEPQSGMGHPQWPVER